MNCRHGAATKSSSAFQATSRTTLPNWDAFPPTPLLLLRSVFCPLHRPSRLWSWISPRRCFLRPLQVAAMHYWKYKFGCKRRVHNMLNVSSSKSYDSDQLKICPSQAINAPAVGFLPAPPPIPSLELNRPPKVLFMALTSGCMFISTWTIHKNAKAWA